MRCVLFFFLMLVLPGVVVAADVAASKAVVPVPETPREFVYDEHGQRDPFWPLVTAGGAIVTYETSFSVAEMTLEGIVTDGQGGIAIINGIVVEQGGQFGAYRVEKVEQDKVTLMQNGQTSILRLKKEE